MAGLSAYPATDTSKDGRSAARDVAAGCPGLLGLATFMAAAAMFDRERLITGTRS